MSNERTYPRDVQAEAADWVVRLRSADLDADDALAFDAWLEASTTHARAYDAAMAVSMEYGREAAAVAEGLANRRVAPRTISRRFYLAAGSMAAAAAVAVVVAPALQPQPVTETYVTAKGE